ncbi:MAG: DsbE family thiol:disulfide interchange protein [Gammaproteobacteria bacterium]|nr:DsbE family thiol:disulfide interchange protein [Gammaproteobacteria bacterium]
MAYLLPLAVLAGLVGLFAVGLHRDPSRVPSPLLDKPAPASTLPVLETSGQVVQPPDMKLSALRGQPLLVNFFASWCVACRDEHDFLLQLAREHSVRIVGIDYKDTDQAARRWLADNGDPYALVLADRLGDAGIDWGVYGVPETFVIDAAGVIRYKQIGPLTEADFRAHVAPLLGSG